MEAKYLDLLDEETRLYVKHTEDFYPADAVDAPIEKQREYYDALCAEYHIEYPETVTSTDRVLKTRETTISLRDYVCSDGSPKAHIVFYHGGGFVVGGLESHDSICAEFCGRTGCNLTAVDYRLAPEFVHPAAFDDAMVAYQRVANETDLPLILVGDSAGGNLAAAVAHAVRGNSRLPSGQVLIYPALGGDETKGSYIEHANAPALTMADIEFYHEIRAGDNPPPEDATSMPLRDKDFSDLPPTVIFTAECDPLADDGGYYRDRLMQSGINAHWINEPGLVHGYLRARSTVKKAAESVTRMVEAINMLADGEWRY